MATREKTETITTAHPTKAIEMFAVVETRVDRTMEFPGGLRREVPAGTVGTVVDELPDGAYEVEFTPDPTIPYVATAVYAASELRLHTPQTVGANGHDLH
jgi:hypothetical protein